MSGSETVLKQSASASARRVVRGLFHRRADALDHADQDQKCDRREGERLCDQYSGPAVKPAGWLSAKKFGDENGHCTRQTEEQDQSEADHERRRDDGQDGQWPDRTLVAKSRPGHDQRKAETKRCGNNADGNTARKSEFQADAAARTGQRHPRPQSRLSKNLDANTESE